jgi:hypothetical protein
VQVRDETLRDVEQALRRYEQEVAAAGLKPSSAHTYILHARSFVRWLKGDFTPGATLPGRDVR